MEYYLRSTDMQISQRKLEGYYKLGQIIQWGRANPVKFCEYFYGIEFLDMQKYIFMNTWTKPFVVWCITRNGGKALSLDTKIPTPTGFTTMRDIKVGDYVLDEQGKPTKVIFTSEIFNNHKCYEVEFEDGEKIIADEEHLWYVKVKDQGEEYKILKTKDMIYNFVHMRKDGKGKEYKYRVPMNKPIEYTEKELPIHPYILGVWLGDGNSRDTRVTCSIFDTENMVENITNCSYSVRISKAGKKANNLNIGFVGKWEENIFRTKLFEMGLIKNKHIPEEYLTSSIEQRYELLRGLMDTNGSCYSQNNGKCEFTQKDYNLIMQFSRLLSSLGIKHSVNKRNIKCNGRKCVSYRIIFYTDKEHSCFKLKRKHERLKNKLNKRMSNKSIISIKEVNSVPTKCIGVDNPMHLYLCGERNTVTHNSTMTAPLIMAKGNLIPNHYTYILSNSSAQSAETFMKIEKIAKKQISSFTGLTDFFLGELVKSVSNTDGFTHNPSGFKYQLYNGSTVTSLTGSIDNNRGRRSNLNVYDESGWTSEEYCVATLPFLSQDADFKLGGGINVSLSPKQIQNQRLFISSASSTDTYFYKVYKEYAKQMLLGNSNYFVADINCEIMFNATVNGKLYPVSLLNKNTVEDEMKKNKSKALREYYNKFSTEGGEGQVIKRATIIRNSEVRRPILANDGTKKFIIAQDPARSYDNSICVVAEIVNDENVGLKANICNIVTWVDVCKKKKTPMMTPDQINHFKELLLNYNGDKCADYENIEQVLIDDGAGGGGISAWGDGLISDWFDNRGILHRGLIDKEHKEYSNHISKYPNAINKLKLVTPQKYKTEIFDALIEMMDLGLITFTADYDLKGYLYFTEERKGEMEERIYKLSQDEELALKNIDLAKEELVNIYRFDGTNGNYRYDLPPDKKATHHDDRAYAIAMIAWCLKRMRRKEIVNKKRPTHDITKMFQIKAPIIRKQ